METLKDALCDRTEHAVFRATQFFWTGSTRAMGDFLSGLGDQDRDDDDDDEGADEDREGEGFDVSIFPVSALL